MTHAEILAKSEAYRKGELSPAEITGFTGHLEACAACRELVEKWPQAHPRTGLAGRVLARLEEGPVLPSWNRRARWAFLSGTAAAVLLVAAAFWHPEQDWVKKDKYFARFDQGGAGILKDMKENSYE